MAVYRRKGGWQADVYDSNGKKMRRLFATQREARNWEREQLERKRKTGLVAPSVMPLLGKHCTS